MGNYITSTSINVILPGFLKGDTTTGDTAGVAIFSDKIDDAEALVNSYLGRRYALPFTVVPPLVRTLTKALACYNVVRDTGYRGSKKNEYLEEWEKATKTLEAINKGDLTLSLTDGSILTKKSASRISSNTETYTPIFGLDDPKAWKRDDDEIDDTDNSRA